ncbi:MAG: hypothetical protein CMH52_06905 [Myxococcales bacterium]|nr:hypothetical protein [Myxococcales bacterium]
MAAQRGWLRSPSALTFLCQEADCGNTLSRVFVVALLYSCVGPNDEKKETALRCIRNRSLAWVLLGLALILPAMTFGQILVKQSKKVDLTPSKAICHGANCKVKVKPLKFRKVSERRNEITDDDGWRLRVGYQANTFTIDQTRTVFPSVPTSYGLQQLSYATATRVGQPVVGVYGVRPAGYRWIPGRWAVAFGAAGQRIHALDFEALLAPRQVRSGDEDFVGAHLGHVVMDDGIIYASVGHKTYAASTSGWNATLVAVNPATGKIIWQSPPLVSNANRFVLVGDVIVSGYGFTSEPDYIYQISARSGAILTRQKVRSGPEDFHLNQLGRLFVRTYDTDYVYQLSR